MSGLRLARKSFSPPGKFFTAAVAMRVAGQRVFEAMPSFLNSSAQAQGHQAHIVFTQGISHMGSEPFHIKIQRRG